MLGAFMIADFRYDASPEVEDVVVELFWDHGERMGRIKTPDMVGDAMVVHGLPHPEPLPVISAVAYAMVLAAQSNRRLRLSGDQSVWPQEWGTLISPH